MANDFYAPSGSPSTGSSAASAVIRAEFDALRAAFDKMPGLTANGGLPAFVNAGGTALEAANIVTAQSRLGIVSSNELNGIANLNAVGIIARTGAGAYAARTLTGTANQITVVNGNGNAGNMTLSLPNPLNLTGNLGVTGTVNATVSVVTPLVGTVTAADLIFQRNGLPVFGLSGSAIYPTTDNASDLGGAGFRVRQVFAPIIDSSSGTLALKGAGSTAATITNANIAFAGTVDVTGNTTLNNLNVSGKLTGTSSMLSPVNNSLTADVNLNNTSVFFDGPSVAQGNNGTWLATGTVTVRNASGGLNVDAKLWDGTSVIDTSQVLAAVNTAATISLSGFISSPSGNLRISARDGGSAGTIMLATTALGASNKASTITAIRIG